MNRAITTTQDGIEFYTPTTDEIRKLTELCEIGMSGFTSELAPHTLLEARGSAHRDRMPSLARTLAGLAMHTGPEVVVVKLGEHTVETAGPTPTEYSGPGIDNLNPADPWRIVLVGVAGLHGFGYKSLQDGALITSVMPVQELEDVPGHSANATEDLGLHTEAASARTQTVDLTPDVLSLQFIRNLEQSPTTISVPDFSELDTNIIEILSRPNFRILTNPAQGGADNDPNGLVPIVYKHHRLEGEYMFGLTTTRLDRSGNSPIEVEAVETFIDHLEQRRFDELVLQPGDVVFIDNRRAAHGRTKGGRYVPPRYNGTDRYQRRLCLASDLNRLKGYTLAKDVRVVDLAKINTKVDPPTKRRLYI